MSSSNFLLPEAFLALKLITAVLGFDQTLWLSLQCSADY